jgi:hypothetical protein
MLLSCYHTRNLIQISGFSVTLSSYEKPVNSKVNLWPSWWFLISNFRSGVWIPGHRSCEYIIEAELEAARWLRSSNSGRSGLQFLLRSRQYYWNALDLSLLQIYIYIYSYSCSCKKTENAFSPLPASVWSNASLDTWVSPGSEDEYGHDWKHESSQSALWPSMLCTSALRSWHQELVQGHVSCSSVCHQLVSKVSSRIQNRELRY